MGHVWPLVVHDDLIATLMMDHNLVGTAVLMDDYLVGAALAHHDGISAFTDDDTARSADNDPARSADHNTIGARNVSRLWRVLDYSRSGDYGPVGQHDRRHRNLTGGQSRGREQRLAMVDAVEVQAVEIGPSAFKNHQRAAVIPPPQLANLVAAGVDDAELVFLLGVGQGIEIDFHVQVLLRTGLGRRFAARPGDVQLGHLGDVPRGRIDRSRLGLLCRRNRCADQERQPHQQRHSASHRFRSLKRCRRSRTGHHGRASLDAQPCLGVSRRP
ncbi:MAG: hypothetical protein NT090_01530 [Acidobacteria bacterium]|nr:hypothetical protein [Acidobacteriota bacterium]